ncbi:MAG: hypothetical protein M1813_004120 [Trichoglossum hirsutum]|nr:MAG: hypothetical protein M1813_004120 [Trichoglossum hirsutum]
MSARESHPITDNTDDIDETNNNTKQKSDLPGNQIFHLPKFLPEILEYVKKETPDSFSWVLEARQSANGISTYEADVPSIPDDYRDEIEEIQDDTMNQASPSGTFVVITIGKHLQPQQIGYRATSLRTGAGVETRSTIVKEGDSSILEVEAIPAGATTQAVLVPEAAGDAYPRALAQLLNVVADLFVRWAGKDIPAYILT